MVQRSSLLGMALAFTSLPFLRALLSGYSLWSTRLCNRLVWLVQSSNGGQVTLSGPPVHILSPASVSHCKLHLTMLSTYSRYSTLLKSTDGKN
jgi:hypothetical protein